MVGALARRPAADGAGACGERDASSPIHRARTAACSRCCALGDGTLRHGTSWRSTAYGARCEAAICRTRRRATGDSMRSRCSCPRRRRYACAPASKAFTPWTSRWARASDRVIRRGAAPTIELAGAGDGRRVRRAEPTPDARTNGCICSGHRSSREMGCRGSGSTAGSLWSGRREHGRWAAQPILDRAPE